MRLYHVTYKDNLDSILACGIIPQTGERSAEAGEQEPAAYFFASLDDVENALSNWLGEALDEDRELAVLEADLPDNMPHAAEAFEIRVAGIVPPDCIKILEESDLPFILNEPSNKGHEPLLHGFR